MIEYANSSMRPHVYQMWKIVFGDPDSYMQLYFREKYRDENTLVFVENNQPVSSLQMLPITFTFHRKEISAAYYSGLCTLPEWRKKGYMAVLIEKSFAELYSKNVPLAILVPQSEELLSFYEPHGFTQTFCAGQYMPPLPRQVDGDLSGSYAQFDVFFRNRDMTVQKSMDDFRVILEEAQLFDFPPKKSLLGMARVINAETLLQIFAQQNSDKIFSIKINDRVLPQNMAQFAVKQGTVIRSNQKETIHFDVDISLLAQLLLGFQTEKLPQPFANIFPQKEPLIGYMLE